MLPTSHPAPINPPMTEAQAGAAVLADAFSEFSFAASRLEKSYQELQKEVTQLHAVLAERNQALCSSRAENAQVKLTLRKIVDSLPCGVLVVEASRRITLMNPEASRLLGPQGKQIESLDDTPLSDKVELAESMGESSAEDLEEEVCIATSSAPRWLGLRRRRLGGESMTLTPASPAIPQEDTVLIVRDITSQRKLEEERERARNVVALAEMAAVLAHEIHNPLASLELFAGLIGQNPADAAEYVAHLRAGIRSLSAMVNNVLRLHASAPVPWSRLELGEALRGAVEFVRPLASQKQIELSFTDKLHDMWVASDTSSIQQLVLNLAINAIRHTAPGGRLQILATCVREEAGTRATIEFSDNGCGIAPEVQNRIFEAGFSGNGQSPGLGLAVCREIVEQHGGTIRVSSVLGEGTSFVVELPAAS